MSGFEPRKVSARASFLDTWKAHLEAHHLPEGGFIEKP